MAFAKVLHERREMLITPVEALNMALELILWKKFPGFVQNPIEAPLDDNTLRYHHGPRK